MEAVFRTCAQTGLKVDRQAERLIKVHAVAGVFAILFGGISAVRLRTSSRMSGSCIASRASRNVSLAVETCPATSRPSGRT